MCVCVSCIVEMLTSFMTLTFGVLIGVLLTVTALDISGCEVIDLCTYQASGVRLCQ